jgi:hypothetical protein
MLTVKVWTATTPRVEPNEYEVVDYQVMCGGVLSLAFTGSRELLISPNVWREAEITINEPN